MRCRLAQIQMPMGPQHIASTIRDAVVEGITGSGDVARLGYSDSPSDAGLDFSARAVIVWTDRDRNQKIAERERKAGGKVIVMENGYFEDSSGAPHFQWAFDGYNGNGNILRHSTVMPPSDTPSRWNNLGLVIHPRTRTGKYIVVLAQRGFGPPAWGHEPDWPRKIVKEIRKHTDRSIVYRPHPGTIRPPGPIERARYSWDEPLERALEEAHCVVSYRSGAALTALRLGIPVIALGGAQAITPLAGWRLEDLEQPVWPSIETRREVFERLAWFQWSADEFKTGAPWRFLMENE